MTQEKLMKYQWSEYLDGLVQAGLSEKKLAQKWQVSVRTLQRLRKGETQEPRFYLGLEILMTYYEYKYADRHTHRL